MLTSALRLADAGAVDPDSCTVSIVLYHITPPRRCISYLALSRYIGKQFYQVTSSYNEPYTVRSYRLASNLSIMRLLGKL